MVDTNSGSNAGDAEDGQFDLSSSLIPLREIKAASITHVAFDGALKHPLLLKEDLKKDVVGSFGLQELY